MNTQSFAALLNSTKIKRKFFSANNSFLLYPDPYEQSVRVLKAPCYIISFENFPLNGEVVEYSKLPC